ncbi:glycerol acyltransferase [Muricauda sp. JGD-17]|uniref:Glycerol acyltransferase n=1 Tax=Flagellimonas ochracea TaxID=2696472 RepID=A0A964T8T6_9FLAO|nr:lysophospholipid acyltransferase family protein [Allomuricauda ochracea]NAY90347.1 glycerol acyltransferase [Allomuricauda ochracea]
MSLGLFLYYKRIKAVGREHIPSKQPVLFLSNHQNALLDVLLIATRCRRKPWFLARSDVFDNPWLRSFFTFLQMLPIYRFRDGRDTLPKNNMIFDTCANLLEDKQAIVLFPEANHSLKRRIRPLSKGFTRIVHAALQKNPGLDLLLVPVGQNYANPMQVGDSTTIHFGKPIAVQQFIGANDFVGELKQQVFDSLTTLTAHFPEDGYDAIIQEIGKNGKVYLDPEKVNAMVANKTYTRSARQKDNLARGFLKNIFLLWNLPVVLIWRIVIKPKVPEDEFMATYRFGFSLLFYSLIYLVCLLVLVNVFNMKPACLAVFGHAGLNILLVKIGITSSFQRK